MPVAIVPIYQRRRRVWWHPSKVAAVEITGTGDITIGAPAIDGAGAETFTGTGDLSIGAPAIAASGSLAFSGTGTVSIGAPSIAAAGLETLTGTSTIAIGAPSIASSGAETFTGTSTLLIAAPIIDGTAKAGQIAVSDADISVGAWTTDLGGTTNLYQSIDEAVIDTADYIQSETAPSASVYRGRLSDLELPESGTRMIRWTIRKSPSGAEQVDAVLRLYEDASLVQTFTRTNVPDDWTTYEETVSNAVGDYADLEYEVEATQV